MTLNTADFLASALALLLALVLTPLVRALARRLGKVAQPRSDRWHKQETALLGGVAIFLAVALTYLLALPHAPPTLAVLGASAFLWAVGLVDDFVHLKPYQKLIGQFLGAAIVVYSGLLLPWTPSPLFNTALTIFWLVGITNGINLLDNMDGLAGGVALIAAGFLAFHFASFGHLREATLLLVFAAALLGFLVYNVNPASIFMGDCGSMFIGFFLASATLLSPTGGRSRGILAVLAVPVLVLFIPIFDITLVTILRKLVGRAASQGGRDHASHRLVALGMSERHAVWLLYALAAVSGLLALLVRDLPLDLSLAGISCFTLALTWIGIWLAGVQVYEDEEVLAAREKPWVAFLLDLSHKRRIFEVCLDVVLIILAYYFANVLLYGPLWNREAGQQFLQAIPLVLIVKLVTFWALGLYRGLWRYVGVSDLILHVKAVGLSSLACALLLSLLTGMETALTVFLLDGLLLLLMLSSNRFAFRLFRKLLPNPPDSVGSRVLIYGAGDGGELLLRELSNNRALQLQPVAFVDDDPLKQGKVMHGLRVYPGNGQLGPICARHQIQEVLISSAKFSVQRLETIRSDCQAAGVRLKRMRIVIEDLDQQSGDGGADVP